MNVLARYRLARQGVKGGKARRNLRSGPFRDALEKGHFVKALIAVTSCAGCVWILMMNQTHSRGTIDLFVGQPAPKDVFAEMGFTYENREETERLRREAEQKVLPHYSFSQEKMKDCGEGIAEAIQGAAAGPGGEKAKEAAAAPGEAPRPEARDIELLAKSPQAGKISADIQALLLSLSGPRATILLDAERSLAPPAAGEEKEPRRPAPPDASLAVGGAGEDRERHRAALLETARLAVDQWSASVFPRDRRLREAAARVMNACCARGISYDETLTQTVRERAARLVKPVMSRIQTGGKIIERGYEVTPAQMDVYNAYMARLTVADPIPVKMQQQLYDILGLALLIVMLLILSRRYLVNYQPAVYDSNSSLFMIEIVMLGALLVSRGITFIPFGTIQSSWNNIFHYAAVISVPAAGILLTVLMSHTLSLYFVVLLAMIVGVMKGFSLPYMIVSSVGGILATYSSIGVRRRSQFVRAGATIALGNIITVGALDAIANVNIVSAMAGFRAVGGLVSGMASAFLAASLLPLFEFAFNRVTDFRLLELSDLNHPLLKRMFIEAPGTYHHSLMVGTLAEAAAEAVGANPLEVRVGAYFHDIGKIRKPEYFVENAPYGKSKHDELNPSMSKLIILSHVKDGVDIALTYNLNPRIVRAIQEHHGTGLVYFFYRRAEESKEEGEEVAQEDFRYPGPKPQSRETAIILLADAVEAASRSMSRPTPARMASLVREIIYQRAGDGQLDECDLTFNDLRLIAGRFEHVLMSTFHTRVKYPEQEEGDEGVGEEQGPFGAD